MEASSQYAWFELEFQLPLQYQLLNNKGDAIKDLQKITGKLSGGEQFQHIGLGDEREGISISADLMTTAPRVYQTINTLGFVQASKKFDGDAFVSKASLEKDFLSFTEGAFEILSEYDSEFHIHELDTRYCMFIGLGRDGRGLKEKIASKQFPDSKTNKLFGEKLTNTHELHLHFFEDRPHKCVKFCVQTGAENYETFKDTPLEMEMIFDSGVFIDLNMFGENKPHNLKEAQAEIKTQISKAKALANKVSQKFASVKYKW